MAVRQLGSVSDALVVFADIVDSSKYSAILGYQEYAKRLLVFQETFYALGRRYFPPPDDRTIEYCQVNARGDEGTVFVACPQGERVKRQGQLVITAIEFLYHLKARLRFGTYSNQDSAPQRFDIGAGIHWGSVVLTLSQTEGRSMIEGMEGFAINYAKRVESSSREGIYSRIVLSFEAAKCLEFVPLMLNSIRVNMKGIQDDVELFEVESGLFNNLKLELGNDQDDALVLEQVESLCAHPVAIDSQWINALAVSVLECASLAAPISADKERYRRLQYDLAWNSAKEQDPVLLYLRSCECRDSGQRTREIRYLRSILDRYPHCVFAKRLMIGACWAIARKSNPEREELMFARDTAREFLEKFGHSLSDRERSEFKSIIEKGSEETSFLSKKGRKTGIKKRSRGGTSTTIS